MTAGSYSTTSPSLYYKLEGNANQEVLVFSNSLGADLTMWDEVTAALLPHYRILRYDTRGHGKSAVKAGEASVEELGKDILALMDKLNLEKVNFCGLSIGGLTGQWLGIYAPERLHRLIIANSAAKIGTAESWTARIETVRQNGLKSIVGVTKGRWFTPEFVARNSARVEQVLDNFIATDLDGYCACCAAIRDADFTDQIAKIEVPTLVITATEDQVTTVADGQFLTDQIPGSKLVTVQAAHISAIEAKAAFSEALIQFISIKV